MDVHPSRVFMNGNSQALLDTLAGFEPGFVACLEAQQASPIPVQATALQRQATRTRSSLDDPGAMGDSTQEP